MTETLAKASVSGKQQKRLSMLYKLLKGLAQCLGTGYKDN